MQNIPEQIKQQLRRDPILEKWINNYTKNLKNNVFSDENTRPFTFLKNSLPYQNVPMVLVAAGPSLDKNIHILKKYQKNAIILSADVIFFKLLEYDIIPNFVVNIDPAVDFIRFWEGLDTSKSTLICPTTAHPDVLSAWKGKKFFFNQTDIKNSYKEIILKKLVKATEGYGTVLNRFFIGATMLQIASVFKPRPVILIGYDFAYTDGKAYCDGFLDRKIYDDTTEYGSLEHTENIKKLKAMEVNANVDMNDIYGNPIKTNKTLVFYKNSFLELVHRILRIQYIVNATEGGILTGIPNMTLEKCLAAYCTKEIPNKDIFKIEKRKRKNKRRHK